MYEFLKLSISLMVKIIVLHFREYISQKWNDLWKNFTRYSYLQLHISNYMLDILLYVADHVLSHHYYTLTITHDTM